MEFAGEVEEQIKKLKEEMGEKEEMFVQELKEKEKDCEDS